MPNSPAPQVYDPRSAHPELFPNHQVRKRECASCNFSVPLTKTLLECRLRLPAWVPAPDPIKRLVPPSDTCSFWAERTVFTASNLEHG